MKQTQNKHDIQQLDVGDQIDVNGETYTVDNVSAYGVSDGARINVAEDHTHSVRIGGEYGENWSYTEEQVAVPDGGQPTMAEVNHRLEEDEPLDNEIWERGA